MTQVTVHQTQESDSLVRGVDIPRDSTSRSASLIPIGSDLGVGVSGSRSMLLARRDILRAMSMATPYGGGCSLELARCDRRDRGGTPSATYEGRLSESTVDAEGARLTPVVPVKISQYPGTTAI